MSDPHDLQRFLTAQDGVYATALAEIAHGAKRTHWMWFVVPQIAGLGQSPTARFYAIRSLEEARAYLAHPVLGMRLRECVEALQALGTSDGAGGFGPGEAVMLRSSLTLFRQAGGGALFEAALARWFGGRADEATLGLI